MIAWAQLVAKVIEVLLSKTAGRELENRLDKKKAAVRAFLDLHESLLILEHATKMFIAEAKAVSDGSKPRLFRVPLKKVVEEADRGSQLFLRSVGDLHSVIAIYDPALAALLWGIGGFKFLFLQGLAHEFETLAQFKLVPNPESVFFVELSSPSCDDVGSELDQWYAWVAGLNKKVGGSPFFRRQLPAGWKKDALRSRFKALTTLERFADNDTKSLISLAKRLEGHATVLSSTRSNLASFISERFVIDDLLAAQL